MRQRVIHTICQIRAIFMYQMWHSQWQSCFFLSSLVCFLSLANTRTHSLTHSAIPPKRIRIARIFFYFSFWPFMRCNYVYSTVSISELYHIFSLAFSFIFCMRYEKKKHFIKSNRQRQFFFLICCFNDGLHL